MKRKSKKIGEVLLSEGFISQEDLNRFLAIQEKTGSKLGDVLIGGGAIKAYGFYLGLAKHYGCEFVNLLEEDLDEELLEDNECQTYIDLQVMPFKKDDGVMVLATSNPSLELKKWADEKYIAYRFVVTSIFDLYWMVDRFYADVNSRGAQDDLWRRKPISSAKMLFYGNKYKSLSVIGVILSLVCLCGDYLFLPLFVVINIFYLFTLLFKMSFFVSGVAVEKSMKGYVNDVDDITDDSVPLYTILAPMYREKVETIEGLVCALRALDYPACKLDVKLIVEVDDEVTIAAIQKLELESYFHIVRVPVSYPRTKPKACNYALKYARGEYVTIYDAEDRPDHKQLKMVIKKFKMSPKTLACVQCRLNYYNREENMLTKLFSLEYASWFDFMIPGLESLHIPVPLGGTSNHFERRTLLNLCAWDPYNVTEDADLGIRLAKTGMTTSVINSFTLEEAPITIVAWLRQRSRWIKGYMQTYIVHMRRPMKLYRHLGFRGFFGFMFFVGAPSVVFFTMPFVAMISLWSFLAGQQFAEWFLIIAGANFVCGIVLHLLIGFVVIQRHKWKNLLPAVFVFPFYWVLHAIASFKGLYELIFYPHYWDKTEHGVSGINSEKVLDSSEPLV